MGCARGLVFLDGGRTSLEQRAGFPLEATVNAAQAFQPQALARDCARVGA